LILFVSRGFAHSSIRASTEVRLAHVGFSRKRKLPHLQVEFERFHALTQQALELTSAGRLR
jgi:hypothetical protein